MRVELSYVGGFVAVLALALAGASCGSGTAPRALAGTYTLRAVDGAAVPHFMGSSTGWGGAEPDSVFLERGTLVLADDSSWALHLEYTAQQAGRLVSAVHDAAGTFTVGPGSPATLRFFREPGQWSCPNVASSALGVGALGAGSIRVSYCPHLVVGVKELRFER